ncbi:MAG: hypothetical protein J6P34_06345 [Paludibacteraceae bacterium]|nr:hypothetical protein [Paludibacteraceae bacterium]MBO7368543.1 hypothetical protein [Paludibacteraceae bacterium]
MRKKAANSVDGQNPYLRRNRVTIVFNDKEYATLSRYFVKYKVSNKSKFLREAIMKTVLRRLEEDYPSLFD